MWRHIVAIGEIVQEQTSRLWQVVSFIAAGVAGFNKTMGTEIIGPEYHGFSPFWAVLPIALLVAIALYRKVLALEARITPKLEVIFDALDARFHCVSNVSQGRGVREFRIGIKNAGGELVQSCSIRLDNLEDKFGWAHPRVPYGLRRLDNQGPFPLRPDEFKLAYVASLDERQRDSKVVVPFHDGQQATLDRKEYKLTIGAYFEKGVSSVRQFRLFVDNGTLSFVPIDVANR